MKEGDFLSVINTEPVLWRERETKTGIEETESSEIVTPIYSPFLRQESFKLSSPTISGILSRVPVFSLDPR